MINLQFYNRVRELELKEVKNFANLKKLISEFFMIDLSKFILQYYENDNKIQINDDDSYEKFCDFKTKEKYLYIISPSLEKSILDNSKLSYPTFKFSETINIFNEVQNDIEKLKEMFLKSNHLIYTQIKKYVKNITESTLKVNYDNIKENKKIKKKINCTYCDETITTKFYFKCDECPNFSICKLCELRFQNINHHKHDLLYVKNGEEKNTIFQNEKEIKQYNITEIEDILKEETFRYDDDYKIKILLKKNIINIDFKENQEDYEISLPIENIGDKQISNKMKFGRYNSSKNWFKELKPHLLFENANYPVPTIKQKEIKDFKFKINIKNKTPGKYFSILCLKRESYYIEGGVIILEININLQPEDYI